MAIQPPACGPILTCKSSEILGFWLPKTVQGHTGGARITTSTVVMILATQNMKLMTPICAPVIQGSQTLVAKVFKTSTAKITTA